MTRKTRRRRRSIPKATKTKPPVERTGMTAAEAREAGYTDAEIRDAVGRELTRRQAIASPVLGLAMRVSLPAPDAGVGLSGGAPPTATVGVDHGSPDGDKCVVVVVDRTNEPPKTFARFVTRRSPRSKIEHPFFGNRPICRCGGRLTESVEATGPTPINEPDGVNLCADGVKKLAALVESAK